VRVILGAGYEESVAVLRILLLMLPIMGISMPLSMHWMIPMKMESALTRVTIAGALLHVPLAIALGTHYAHIDVAWAVIVTELVVLAVLVSVVLARGVGPFHRGVAVHQPEVEGVR
jgi:O-antigen/teichoic acid export membrane protein